MKLEWFVAVPVWLVLAVAQLNPGVNPWWIQAARTGLCCQSLLCYFGLAHLPVPSN